MPELQTVLLIDDDENIAELIKINLEFDGLSITTASCAGDGIAMAQKIPDLILLDMMLPDADGLDVIDRLKADKKTAGIPILMLSAKSHLPDMEKAVRNGASGYLLKPFDPISLAETLKQKYADIKKTQKEHGNAD